MSDTEENKPNGDSCNSCGGKTKWIWMVLAVVAGVVVFGKLAGNGPSACCGGRAAVVVGGREIGTPQALRPPNSAPNTRLPQLVDLGAGKCIPCKLMAPILDELKSNTSIP